MAPPAPARAPTASTTPPPLCLPRRGRSLAHQVCDGGGAACHYPAAATLLACVLNLNQTGLCGYRARSSRSLGSRCWSWWINVVGPGNIGQPETPTAHTGIRTARAAAAAAESTKVAGRAGRRCGRCPSQVTFRVRPVSHAPAFLLSLLLLSSALIWPLLPLTPSRSPWRCVLCVVSSQQQCPSPPILRCVTAAGSRPDRRLGHRTRTARAR